MSDSQLNVKITADASQMRGEIQRVNMTAAEFAKVLEGVGGNLKKITPDMVGLAAAAKQTGASLSDAGTLAKTGLGQIDESAGRAGNVLKELSINTGLVSRELITIANEVLSVRWSRIPGSIMVMARAMGGLSLAVGGVVIALGIATLAAARFIEKLGQIRQAHLEVQSAAAVYNPQLPEAKLDEFAAQVKKLRGISTEEAGQIVSDFARMKGSTAELITYLIDNINRFANATGDKAPAAARRLAEVFSAPSEQGDAFLATVNASTQAMTQFAAATNDVERRRVMLLSLADAMRRVTDRTETAQQKMNALLGASAVGDPAMMGAMPAAQVRDAAATAANRKNVQEQKDLSAALQSLNNDAKASGKSEWLTEMNIALDQSNEAIERTAKTFRQAHEGMLNNTVSFWEKVLAAGNLTHSEQEQAELRLARAKQQVDAERLTASARDAKTELAEKIAQIDAEQAADRDNFAGWFDLEQRKLALLRAAGGEQSAAYQRELKAEEVYLRAHVEEQHQLELEALSKSEQAGQKRLQERSAELQAETNANEQTRLAQLRILKDEIAAEATVEDKALADYIKTLEAGTKAFQKAVEQRTALAQSFATAQARVDAQIAAAEEKQYRPYVDAFNKIKQSFESTISGLVTGQLTWARAAQNVTRSVLDSFTSLVLKRVTAWIFGDEAMVASTVAKNAAIVASDTAAAIASVATWIAKVVKAIVAYAAETFGGVFAFLSGQMGPYAAGPAAAASGVVLAQAAGASASFAVGAWDLPADTIAQVHAGEMIIPATFAQAMRDNLGGGGGGSGGGGVVFNVSAIDAQSVAAFFATHASSLARTVARHMNANPGARPAY